MVSDDKGQVDRASICDVREIEAARGGLELSWCSHSEGHRRHHAWDSQGGDLRIHPIRERFC